MGCQAQALTRLKPMTAPGRRADQVHFAPAFTRFMAHSSCHGSTQGSQSAKASQDARRAYSLTSQTAHTSCHASTQAL